MTRLDCVTEPYADDVAEDFAKLMPPGMAPLKLFRTLAHNPRVLRRVRKGGLLDRGAVSLRERELVILRTTALCGAEYEWGVHVAVFARAAGLGAAEIAATVSGDVAGLADAEQVLLAVCDALYREATIDDALWARLAGAYRADQIVEVIALAGQYRTISYFVNALGIELEPGAPRFAERPTDRQGSAPRP